MTSKELYLAFRRELDEMCVPLILEECECTEYLVCDGKIVGMVTGTPTYIDCVYVVPGYRRKGLAKRAVLEWYERYRSRYEPVRLHIINNNEVAKKFWHSLFALDSLGSNNVDTLYEILHRKDASDESKI